MKNNISTALGVVISIFIAQMAGVIGSFFTVSGVQNWYAYLQKPVFAPPSWVFAPAWITLYTLMGIAAFLVWKKRNVIGVKSALWLYGIQLGFNALWSIIFFGMRNPGLAFIEILVLWVLILAVTVKFFKIDKAAGYLFIPYILWVTFASVLNFAVWQINF
ncbi:MAG: TspO/MBR family protein [Candidatus Paceibacterota bacterium]|jgi:tryptophan-rich sensory protein